MKKEFPHFVATSIEDVMKKPDKFIIPENLKAIDYLWSLNILTTMTNDYDNDYSWISFGVLSEENYQVLKQISQMSEKGDYSKPGVLDSYGVGIRIPLKPGSKDAFDDFMELLKLFKVQDVQRDGYWTIDQFHSRFTGCVKMGINPYFDAEPNMEDYDDFESYAYALREFDRLYDVGRSEKIPVYDENKATKTLEEYLADYGLLDFYIPEEGRIYKNRRLYEAHLRYKEMNEGKKL